MTSLRKSRALRGCGANTSPVPAEGRKREPFFLGPFRQQRSFSLPSTPVRNRSRANGENVPPPEIYHTAATGAYVKANTPATDNGSPAQQKLAKKGHNGSAIILPPLQENPALLPRPPSAKPSPVAQKLEPAVAQGDDNLGTAKRKLQWATSGTTAAPDTVGPAVVAEPASSDSGVKVILRMRPLNEKEEQEVATKIVQEMSSVAVSLGDQQFTYDAIASEGASQHDVFEMVGLPMVENCLAGFNSSIFAYGQTGSGKTHTMMGEPTGPDSSLLPSDQRGLTPRVIERLFSRMHEEENIHADKGLRYQCRCSFLEIYNEQITDLLEPSQRNLQIREDTKTGVYVDSLTEEFVSNVGDVTRLLLKGLANRRTGATIMNKESSRSHSVFTCVIESRFKNLAKGGSSVRSSRMNLVDLAGSERQKQSGAAGERLKEAGNINKSLSQLGNVINILAEVAQTGKLRHIPYRDSRLTFLLQESLGGNAKLAMICAISAASSCRRETLSTLRFAQRAKVIQNKAVVNEEVSNDVGLLREQIRQLKDELMRMKANGSQESGAGAYSNSWNARRSYNLLRLSLSHPMTSSASELEEVDTEMDIDDEYDKEPETEISQFASTGKVPAQDGFSRLPVIDEKDSDVNTSINKPVLAISDAADREISLEGDLSVSEVESTSITGNDSVNLGLETSQPPETVALAQVRVFDKKDVEDTCISKSVPGVTDIADREIFREVDSSGSGHQSLSNIDDDSVNLGLETTEPPGMVQLPHLKAIPGFVIPRALHSPPQSVSPRLKGMSKRSLSGSPLQPRRFAKFSPGKSTCEEIYHSTQERFCDRTTTSESHVLNCGARTQLSVRRIISTARPTQKLAACLQRGLQILDSHQTTSVGSVRRSMAGLRYSVADFRLPRMVEKFDKAVQTTAVVVVTTSTSPVAQVVAKTEGDSSCNHELVLTVADDSRIPSELSRPAYFPNFKFRDRNEGHLQLTSGIQTKGDVLQNAADVRTCATIDSTTGVDEELNMRSGSDYCLFQTSTIARGNLVQGSEESAKEPLTAHSQISPYANLVNKPSNSVDDFPPGTLNLPKNCDTSNWQLVPVDDSKCPQVSGADRSSPQLHLVQEAVEALLTGAIRRERVIEDAMSKQAAEIEQLNRLVRQYKHERECNAILHQSRENKIARLESLMDNVIPVDTYLNEEWSSLLLQYKMLQEKFDNHPEVTHSSLEQQRLLDELSHYRDFFDLGEREILLDEVKLLRNQVQTLVEGYQSNFSSTSRLRRLSLARISVQKSRFAEEVAESPCRSSLASLSIPLEGPRASGSVKPSMRLSMVATDPSPSWQDEKAEEEVRSSWEFEKREMECDWEEREREWMACLEEWREEAESCKQHAKRSKQELDCEKRCSEEMQDALRMAMTGHARLLEQYAELQEKHILLLAKHRKIKEGTADVKRMAKKAGVTSLEARWLESQALQIAALQVVSEEEKQRSKEQIDGLKSRLRDTADAVQAAGELLVRLKEAEESAIIAQDTAATAEQDALGLRRDLEKVRRRHATEVATFQQRVLESRLQKIAVCPMCVMAERVKFQFTEVDDKTAEAESEALSMGHQQVQKLSADSGSQVHQFVDGARWTSELEDDQADLGSHSNRVDDINEIDHFFTQK